MSEEGEDSGAPHPRETAVLFGHAEAERTLLNAYRGGRIPHAWLIGGPRGIGKATLAYRMARFVLAHPDPASPEVENAVSLAVPDDNPTARRIASESHTDLLALQRVINEKTGKLFQDIRVEDIRRSVSFFGSTAGEGGWRVAIVDPVEDLNPFGENALLKILEEPPARSLLFLISHVPGRLLPTIRSRCRMLLLRPLAQTEIAQAVAAATGRSAGEPEILAAAAAGDGSVGRGIELLDGKTLALRQKVTALLDQLPNPDSRAMHALGDSISGTESAPLLAFVDLVNEWLASRLKTNAPLQSLAQVAHAWDAINRSAQDVDEYNLDRKPLVFSVFDLLAEAARA